jgi:hypothetical protein
MSTYTPAYPHDPIEQLFDDVYWVHGSIKMGPGMLINRNMVILRHEGELTLLGPVRLSDEGERALRALGDVKHIVRVGFFHGCDDAYYQKEHGAKFWCQERSNNFKDGPEPDEIIKDGSELPVPGAKVIAFARALRNECVVHLEAQRMLVSCDSVQHHVDTSNCSLLAKGVMHLMGFMKPTNIGPPWRKFMTPPGGSLKPDFDRILELDFDHLVGAHGGFCRGGARDLLAERVRAVYGA